MKEYKVIYKINGVQDIYYVTVSPTNLPFSEIRFSIINELKAYLKMQTTDKLEIVDIQENK